MHANTMSGLPASIGRSRKKTEIEGRQGAMSAMEVDLPNRMPPRNEATSRANSDEWRRPTRAATKAEDDAQRKPHHDTTPAA